MDDDIPSIRIPTEAFMDEVPTLTAGSRRNEDIALDLMKFIAMTTGYELLRSRRNMPGTCSSFIRSA